MPIDPNHRDLEDHEFPDASDQDDDLDGPDLVSCPECGGEILEQTDICPHCGAFVKPDSEPERMPWWVWVGLIVVIGMTLLLIFIR